MTINLADPNWLAVIIAIATALVAGSFALARLFYQNQSRKTAGLEFPLTHNHILVLVQIHGNSVISELGRKAAIFLYTVQAKRQQITEQRLEELKQDVLTIIKERRELLSLFLTPYGALDAYIAKSYPDEKFEQDFQRFKAIALSNLSPIEKSERAQDLVRQIQVRLRESIREDLRASERARSRES